jgi:hypothetical protein
MLADQSIVTADRTTNADLFWAVRGGTGGNFGVLLEVVYRLADLGDVWGCCVRWSGADAPAVLAALQADFMRSGATARLGYQLAVASVDGSTALMFMGMFAGPREEGLAVLQPLLAIGSPAVTLDRMGRYEELNSALIDGWFTMPPADTLEVKSCAYIARPLTPEEWGAIIDYVGTAPNPYNMIAMEVYGGAVSAVPEDDCAFIHRQVDFDLFIDSFCNPAWNYNDEETAKEWLAGFVATLQPLANGHRYQNYPDRADLDYRWAYWGDAFPTLLQVKAKYDPDGVFTYGQAITAYPEDAAVTRSGAAPQFTSRAIVHEPHARPGMLTVAAGARSSPAPFDAPQVGFGDGARQVDPAPVAGYAAKPDAVALE